MEKKAAWRDVALTAVAPAIWGSTYYVTSEFLPDGYPLTLAVLRALPAGLLLMLIIRRLPPAGWLWRIVILGALNFSIFWALLFVAAYVLPGGVAATLGALQAIVVVFLSHILLKTPILKENVTSAAFGVVGVALLLNPSIALDPLGIGAALGCAVSMALGTVLSRKWQPPVSPLTFTAWQLTAGGGLLVPFALWFEPPLPSLSADNYLGLLYLGLIGAAVTYYLWFRGVARIDPAAVSILGFFSPLTAVLLGWVLLGQVLSPFQMVGGLIVLGCVWCSQNASRFAKLA